MSNEWIRTEAMIGPQGIERLAGARVAVFGIGGVGSYAAEALARSGIGSLCLIDGDVVAQSNLNRQLVALCSTIGQPKAEVMKKRVLDINPRCEVQAATCFYSAENADRFDFSTYDYIVDAIDTVTSKLLLIERAYRVGTPVVSSMGAGNKLDPSAFEVADIYETSVCPLARVMRQELRKRGVPCLKVVYSKEKPVEPTFSQPQEMPLGKRQTPGSMPFVPGVAGLILAGVVIRNLALQRL